MPWVLRGLRNGVVTTGYPRRKDSYADSFPGAVEPIPGAVGTADELCPTGAIRDAPLRVDTGKCVLCGRCVRERPELFRWRQGSQVSGLTRNSLVLPDIEESEDSLAAVRAELAVRTAGLRRSLHVRHVDAGSDGSDEWEVLALLNPVYDVHRLGIFFTASPRHADVLLITGTGTHGMAAPLRRTLEATARPVVVIAAGVDAISGGMIAPGYATGAGVGELLNVDIWVPGSPATPFALLCALLTAMGRMDAKGRRT